LEAEGVPARTTDRPVCLTADQCWVEYGTSSSTLPGGGTGRNGYDELTTNGIIHNGTGPVVEVCNTNVPIPLDNTQITAVPLTTFYGK
jgi:hypothetical protein